MRLRSIPPVTSTGSNRRKTSAPLQGLAHISLGRYMSDMKNRRKNEDDDAWDITRFARSEFNRKPNRKMTVPLVSDTMQEFNDRVALFDDYNEEGDFAIQLQFSGIEFLSDAFTSCSIGSARKSYFIPVHFINNKKESYLLLTTAGDIFEYEVVRDINNCCTGNCFIGNSGKKISKPGEMEFCSNRLFRNEAYIPKILETHDWLTMNVVLTDTLIIVTYKKR